jgi:hypothetical protein
MPFDRQNVQQEATHVRDVITTSEPVLNPDWSTEGQPELSPAAAQPTPPVVQPASPVPEQEGTPTGSYPVVPSPAPEIAPGEQRPDPLAERRSRIPITAPVASALFGHFVAAENLQEFLAEEGHLGDRPTLNEAQLRLLEIVRELTDPELFEEKSEVDLDDATSLTTNQKQDLTIFAGVTNPLEFVRHTGQLDNQGLQITEDQMLELGQALAARSLGQQKEEFGEQTGKLADTGETVLKEFVEHRAPDTVPASDGQPSILGNAGFATDYKDLTSMHVDEVDAKYEAQGFKAHAAEEETEETKDVHYSKYAAPAAVAVLCILAFTLPALIHVSTPAVAEPEVAAEQTKILINDEIRAQSPRNQRPSAAPFAAPSAPGSASPAAAANDPSISDPLSEAAAAKYDGNYEKAIAILEEALSANPQAVDARIELIRLYKKQKNLKRARALAVIGFRAAGNTPKQRDALWDLFMECCEPRAHS